MPLVGKMENTSTSLGLFCSSAVEGANIKQSHTRPFVSVQQVALLAMHLFAEQLINHVSHHQRVSVHMPRLCFHLLIKSSHWWSPHWNIGPWSFLWSPSVNSIRLMLKLNPGGATASCCPFINQDWFINEQIKNCEGWDSIFWCRCGVTAEISSGTIMSKREGKGRRGKAHVSENRSKPYIFAPKIITYLLHTVLKKHWIVGLCNKEINCKTRIPSKAVQ